MEQEEGAQREVVSALRETLVLQIEETLEALKSSLGYWEKAHIANAIAALGWNAQLKEDTTAWLRLASVSIDNARTPRDQRNENYVPKEEQLEALTYRQLLDALHDASVRGWSG